MHTPNGSAFSGAICALVIMALVVLGCGRFGGRPEGGVGNLINEPLPAFDPAEPFPALSMSMIDALITELPELGKHRDAILNTERHAINGVFKNVRAKSPAAIGKVSDERPGSESLLGPSSLRQMPSGSADFRGHVSITMAAFAEVPEISSVLSRNLQSSLIGRGIGFSMPDYGTVSRSDDGKTIVIPTTDDTGTVLATETISINNSDGSESIEWRTKVSLPTFGLDANSRVKMTGNQCPNSEGKLDLTVEHSSNGRAGSSGTIIYDKNITARIKASVNDSAELVSMDLDLKQATRSTAGGRQVYVETSQGVTATKLFGDIETGAVRSDRSSSQTTSADRSISADGLSAAYHLSQGLLSNAEGRWKNGGCVKIDAPSPGRVALNSTTQIPVKVVHKGDGSDVPSKLEVTLKGERSVDPTSIAKTAGTLTYAAPGEMGKTATISLTATSRRGRATLDLKADTAGQSFHISGKIDDARQDGDVCDSTVSFTVPGTLNMKFTPTSATEGTYTYTGPFKAKGSGSYVIVDNGPMIVTGNGCILGHCAEYSHTWRATPIDPKNCGG